MLYRGRIVPSDADAVAATAGARAFHHLLRDVHPSMQEPEFNLAAAIAAP